MVSSGWDVGCVARARPPTVRCSRGPTCDVRHTAGQLHRGQSQRLDQRGGLAPGVHAELGEHRPRRDGRPCGSRPRAGRRSRRWTSRSPPAAGSRSAGRSARRVARLVGAAPTRHPGHAEFAQPATYQGRRRLRAEGVEQPNGLDASPRRRPDSASSSACSYGSPALPPCGRAAQSPRSPAAYCSGQPVERGDRVGPADGGSAALASPHRQPGAVGPIEQQRRIVARPARAPRPATRARSRRDRSGRATRGHRPARHGARVCREAASASGCPCGSAAGPGRAASRGRSCPDRPARRASRAARRRLRSTGPASPSSGSGGRRSCTRRRGSRGPGRTPRPDRCSPAPRRSGRAATCPRPGCSSRASTYSWLPSARRELDAVQQFVRPSAWPSCSRAEPM